MRFQRLFKQYYNYFNYNYNHSRVYHEHHLDFQHFYYYAFQDLHYFNFQYFYHHAFQHYYFFHYFLNQHFIHYHHDWRSDFHDSSADYYHHGSANHDDVGRRRRDLDYDYNAAFFLNHFHPGFPDCVADCRARILRR